MQMRFQRFQAAVMANSKLDYSLVSHGSDTGYDVCTLGMKSR